MLKFVLIFAVAFSPSVTAGESAFRPTSEAKWDDDGWSRGFAEAHCYMGNTYVDESNDALDIVNINFIQIANLSLAKSEYSFGLWHAINQVGVRQDELIFAAAMPGPLDWRGDKRTAYAVGVSVGGLEATRIDTSAFIVDSDEQSWFVIREPQSNILIEKFSEEKPVKIDVVLDDNSQLTFEYYVSPDLDFKVNRAQFEACLRVLAPDIDAK